ncbi:beta-xylosidase [Shouchella clausii]|uniref:Xylan 1,4-beta-xylosidase n=1 Tax=Shouchella clausii (strain KSM-K16) TaxID=66692 RepID=Q5WKL1_SHOC1|nr:MULTISPECIES: glycoside hydrolase family 43 protein [Shouchella]PAD44385.1 glycoside hydrolase 43 family protein [Bacillus sp. 7520-S]MCM3379564.1 glycoside hydrolase family 43 protein [Shouchella rhizosphaerae]PAE99031.1 glycoside hydrolase 43 family protein [Shouchella clausii]BAD63094.1 xylan 1,4-beta-xylosidase [Shouchella clausii KSM-K16]GIN09014.1 beta-xylosidase [Shouchella clausii]
MIRNPVLKGFNPDPSICRVGDDYYMAVSTFEWFPGVQIHHSRDLVNWRLISRPLNRISQLNMIGNPDSGGVWAPCLSYSNGKFWLVYSDVKVVEGNTWKDGHNYLVTCETIDGEWSEPIYLNSSGFDPSLFHDEDGRKYVVNMVWDQRVYNHRFYGICIQEYSVLEKRLVGKPQMIFKGTELGLTEAPHLYQANGYYYLLTAEGGTKYEHAATIARSKDIYGPYEVHPQNPILSSWADPSHPLQKAGHASLVETQHGDWYMAHLLGRPIKRQGKKLLEERGFCPLGRETAIQKIEWKDDWPYVVNGPLPSVEVAGPKLPEVQWPQDYPECDPFDHPVLNHHYQTLRIPFNEEIGMIDHEAGILRLFGRESLHSKHTQALVARRWQSFHFDAATEVSFYPETFQQAAGLICYYDTENWVSLQVTWHEQKGRILDLVQCDHFHVSQPLQGSEIVVPEQAATVHLKVSVRYDTFSFAYSFDGSHFEDIGVSFDTYKLSDDYIAHGGFFTGAFVGMHCQDTSGVRKHADFHSFSYHELESNSLNQAEGGTSARKSVIHG